MRPFINSLSTSLAQVFRSYMKSNLHIPDIAQCQHREVEKEGMPVSSPSFFISKDPGS